MNLIYRGQEIEYVPRQTRTPNYSDLETHSVQLIYRAQIVNCIRPVHPPYHPPVALNWRFQATQHPVHQKTAKTLRTENSKLQARFPAE